MSIFNQPVTFLDLLVFMVVWDVVGGLGRAFARGFKRAPRG